MHASPMTHTNRKLGSASTMTDAVHLHRPLRNRAIVFAAIAVIGCLVDLVTKSWIFAWLGLTGEPHWIWPNYVGLQTTLNRGALFGLGQGMTPVFAVLSIGAAVGIVYWLFARGAARNWLLTIALSLVMGGIFGNLYDRLGFGLTIDGERVYAVRDWILLQAGPNYRWPNFNIADSLLVCGAALLMWQAFTEPSGTSDAPADAGR